MMQRLVPALPLLFLATAASAAPVTYQIDPSHTYPSFEVPHLGISWWRGKFNSNSGTVVLDRERQTGTVDIVIDTASIDFGHERMNEHARADDFLHVEKYPQARYRGTIRFENGEPVAVDGQLTLLETTKAVPLTIESFACIEHPFLKREVCGADAHGEFHRGDFGVGKFGDGALGRVKLRIQAEGFRQ